ncbi:hypothetical protein LTR98_002530 [Exophiala xenobiotica]|nr:hypothetical protein LTR98_002530 [Exophiala xenobiotica]KAK5441626.1 hypothetical protein LTR18_006548 [Exophiala xenobiotica]KAK5540360.1 hypothetical protein LTR23_006245 [Chaetothyriales sp. CCFEE 6169]KAK5555633.1 hypothetical protein LTR46_006074 [Exophiala xenobiotica]
MSMLAPSSAYDMQIDALVHESSFFKELEAKGEIHIDLSEPPSRRDLSGRGDTTYLQKRQDDVVPTTVSESETSSTSSITSAPSTSAGVETTSAPAIATDTDTNLSPTVVSTSISPSITVVTTPLPSPFDTSLGSNFTQSSCPSFFSTFLSNSTFQSCVAVSLLLQNSNSFFRAMRSATLLTQTLDSACNAPLAICSPLMTNLASQLIDADNCGQDFKAENALVSQAYAGLIAYEPVYRATCLHDSITGGYCFSQAITNTTNQADSYPYYSALGLSMPTDARPTCSQCLKDTMTIFAGYAQDTKQPLSNTYLTSANQIDAGCGAGFAELDIKIGSVDVSSQKMDMLHYVFSIGVFIFFGSHYLVILSVD